MPGEIAFLVAFVSSVISVLGNKLAGPSLNEIKKYLDVELNLLKLTNGINVVQSDLEKVRDDHLAHCTFRSWVQELAMLCYDVDDIVDDINLEIMKLDHHHQRNCSSSSVANQHGNEVNSWFTWLIQIPWVNKSVDNKKKSQVKEIISSSLTKWNLPNRIDDLLKRLNDIQLQVNSAVRQSTSSPTHLSPRARRGYQYYQYHLTRQRLCEKEGIIHELTSMQNGGITIVGMAGLGKSVLAHSVLNDYRIARSFNVINWAYSSNWNYSVDHDIVIEPVTSLNCCSSAQQTQQPSSLLLLDDLRVTGLRDWVLLKARLVSMLQHQPTVFIITCRDPAVAKYTETTPHLLNTLSIEDCKQIICRNMSSNGYVEDYYYRVLLSNINCIASKCGGLPLVADVIGLHLRSEYRSHTNNFMNAISQLEQGDFWKLPVFLHDILPELGFDAKSLPKKLYKFLAYFALFPCDYYFNKDELSLLWMAEGFTSSVAMEWTLKPAIDHFNSLVSTSMLQLKRSSSTRAAGIVVPCFKMHVFAHKFAQVSACSTYFWLNEGKLSSIENGDIPSNYDSSYIRHFSSCCRKLKKSILLHIQNYHEKLRTFLLLVPPNCNEIQIEEIPMSFFKTLEYLRVLSLGGSDIKTLPQTISKLKHLRYLDVSYTKIEKLPIEMCSLLALQVLKLKNNLELLCLPDNFSNLINLTYLDLNMLRLSKTPANLGKLTKLEILPLFIVKLEDGHGVSELKNMKSLSGSVKITRLENVTMKSEAKEAMLHEKPKITSLGLEWTMYSNQDSAIAQDILTCLKPSEKLKELKVLNYNGMIFPNWVNTLKDVGDIYLYNCSNCTVFPFFGLLRLLKKLKVEKMPSIQKVARSSYRGAQHNEYPTLEYLELRNMKILETWNIMPGDMLSLREVCVMDCPQLISLPMIRHVTRPQVIGCPKLKFLRE